MDSSECNDAMGKNKERTYLVRNATYGETSFVTWDGPLFSGTTVVYQSAFGDDLGIIVSTVQSGSGGSNIDKEEEREKIVRVATPSDMALYNKNSERELHASDVFRKTALKHNLDMRLVACHFLLGERKVLFFYTSDHKIDFRNFVRSLAKVFDMRVELRQMSVRDEFKMLGGIASCGREYCCRRTFAKNIAATADMAKEQGFVENTFKPSGPCGKRVCCLSYEYKTYCTEKQKFPEKGVHVEIEKRDWEVVGINIFKDLVALYSKGLGKVDFPLSGMRKKENEEWEVSEEGKKILSSYAVDD